MRKFSKTEVAKVRAIFAEPLLHEVLDEIEQAAVNGAVNANTSDHESRQAFCVEARVTRRVRSKLKNIAADHRSENEEET